MKAKTLWIIGLVLSLFWWIFYIRPEYFANHTYYLDMIKDSKNIYLILASILASAIPVLGVVYFGKTSMQKLITTFFVGFLVFAISNVMIKDSLIGNWFLMIVVNFGIMLGLMLYFSAGFVVIGDRLRKRFSMQTWNATDVIMNLWLWFGTFLVLNYILLMANIYYGAILWAIFAIFGGIIYAQKQSLDHNTNILAQVFDKFSIKNANNISWYIWIALLLWTIMYIYYGLWMSYIPYSTAWDANHAYMAIPRMYVNNHGVLWADNIWWFGSTVQSYLWYVSYFMWIFTSFGGKFWISPDTAGVVMNFLPAIYTILVFLALLQAFAQWFGDDADNSTKLWFDIGRFGILQWMTSGMWAFLVIVDNKSDFGIMFLGGMWLLFGMRYILSDKGNIIDDKSDNSNNIYNRYNLTFSAVMFALAIVSKATALFDAMNFGLLLGGLYFGYFIFAWLVFLILWWLSYSGLNGVSNFISKFAGNISGGIWLILSIFWLENIVKNIKSMWRILSWIFVLLLSIFLLKWPSMLYSNYKANGSIQPSVIKSIFLAANEIPLPSNNNITDPKVCTLWAVWYSKAPQLYTELKDVKSDGYSEDVGRYVWFGQKEFDAWGFWWFVLPNKTCITINNTARNLCNNNNKLNISLAQDMLKSDSYDNEFLSGVISYYNKQKNIQTSGSLNQDINKKLTDYITDKTIYIDAGKIWVPYKLLLPLNVSFNRSLQNLSSYYTDIWLFWIFAWIVILVWFVYSIATRNKKLLLTTGITLAGWIYWIFVWWGIVRYGIGMISWTVISVAMTFDTMINNEEEETKSSNISNRSYIYLMIIILYGLVQIFLNFTRISSQNTWWVFTQYKFSNGMVNETANTLETKNVKKFPYKANDIFNLQFPIYNKILTQVNGDNEAGKMDYNILIAGTYSKYFVNNWANIYDDWFLALVAKWFSDWDQCKSYLRLKDKKLKYMIIDPNIASIVMWWWNSSLMDRFFAKIDSETNKITQDWAFTMLSKLNTNNYISLYYTNVIPTKYAYILSDVDFAKYFGITDKDKIILARAKLATLRFWPNEGNDLAAKTIAILKDRILNGEWYYDLADMFGKIVDKTKVQPVIVKMLAWWLSQNDLPAMSWLTDDERVVLSQYYGIYQQVKWWSDEALTNTIRQSLQWGSQVIVFEVK